MTLAYQPQLCGSPISPNTIAAAVDKSSIGIGVRTAMRHGQNVIVRRPHEEIARVLIHALAADSAYPLVPLEQYRDQDALERHTPFAGTVGVSLGERVLRMSSSVGTSIGVQLLSMCLAISGIVCALPFGVLYYPSPSARGSIFTVLASVDRLLFFDSVPMRRDVDSLVSGQLFAVSGTVGSAVGIVFRAVRGVIDSIVGVDFTAVGITVSGPFLFVTHALIIPEKRYLKTRGLG